MPAKVLTRRELERHMRRHGCRLRRQGDSHEVWQGPGGVSTVPRHAVHQRGAIRVTCVRLGIPRP